MLTITFNFFCWHLFRLIYFFGHQVPWQVGIEYLRLCELWIIRRFFEQALKIKFWIYLICFACFCDAVNGCNGSRSLGDVDEQPLFPAYRHYLCFAHARREFTDAKPMDSRDWTGTSVEEAIRKIGNLFHMDKTYALLSADKILSGSGTTGKIRDWKKIYKLASAFRNAL